MQIVEDVIASRYVMVEPTIAHLEYHPPNVYPVLVAVANVPHAELYFPVCEVFDGVPPIPSYVSVYVFAVHCAVYVYCKAFITVAVVVDISVHPANVYPVRVTVGAI